MSKSRFGGGTLGNGRWDEEEHPRGKDGRFAVAGGGSSGHRGKGASKPKTLVEQYAKSVTEAAQKNAMMPKRYYSDFESSDILYRMRSGEDVALYPENDTVDTPRAIQHTRWGFQNTRQGSFSEKELKERLMKGELKVIKKSEIYRKYW